MPKERIRSEALWGTYRRGARREWLAMQPALAVFRETREEIQAKQVEDEERKRRGSTPIVVSPQLDELLQWAFEIESDVREGLRFQRWRDQRENADADKKFVS